MKVFDSMIPPTVYNVIFIGISAVIVIALGKFITAKYKIPGLSDLFAAA
jgi:hypothetical protein